MSFFDSLRNVFKRPSASNSGSRDSSTSGAATKASGGGGGAASSSTASGSGGNNASKAPSPQQQQQIAVRGGFIAYRVARRASALRIDRCWRSRFSRFSQRFRFAASSDLHRAFCRAKRQAGRQADELDEAFFVVRVCLALRRSGAPSSSADRVPPEKPSSPRCGRSPLSSSSLVRSCRHRIDLWCRT